MIIARTSYPDCCSTIHQSSEHQTPVTNRLQQFHNVAFPVNIRTGLKIFLRLVSRRCFGNETDYSQGMWKHPDSVPTAKLKYYRDRRLNTDTWSGLVSESAMLEATTWSKNSSKFKNFFTFTLCETNVWEQMLRAKQKIRTQTTCTCKKVL